MDKKIKETKHVKKMTHYDEIDINGRLIISFREISHTMRSLYEGKGSQKRILIILNETGVITQQALTKRLGIQPGSASEVIAKLESAELITRTPSEIDHRTTDITLTEKGRKLSEEAVQQRERRHIEMFSCLSDEEKNQLIFLLEKIQEDWKERYEDIEKRKKYHGQHHGHSNCHGRK